MKKTVIVLYVVVVVVMAAATIVEKYQGTEYVSDHIFGAWWFSALWALLTAVAVVCFLRRKVRRLSVVLLHLSFVVILAGALLTHLTGSRGVVALRKGVPANEYLTRDMYLHKLPFTIMIAYLLLLLTFLCSLVALCLPKRREKMFQLSQLMLFPSLTLLGFGIFIGAIWANLSWGTYWSWDPKETWALITFMLYAAPAHRSFAKVSMLKYHLYMTLAFFAIVITYLGVNYFLGGMHSYA